MKLADLNLEKLLKKRSWRGNESSVCQPVIFDFRKPADRKKAERLIKSGNIAAVIDELADQKKELAVVKNPRLLRNPPPKTPLGRDSGQAASIYEGRWVYYPWLETLVHILSEKDFQTLRLSRNQNLILPAEQEKFGKARIAIAGLNVGNPAAICLALEGGGSLMKFADNDVLSLSNLNRFRAGTAELGLNKAILSAQQVYEINPYAKIEVFPQGLKIGQAEKFLTQPRADILIEEMDNLPLKIEIREAARRMKIPVVMVTGNGPNVIIDIERFDLNPNLPLMSGYLKPKIIETVKTKKPNELSFEEKIFLARDFMGEKFLVERLRKSFLLVGKRLAGIPQIAESSFLRGAALSYVVRQIVTGKKVRSGRYYLKLDNVLG